MNPLHALRSITVRDARLSRFLALALVALPTLGHAASCIPFLPPADWNSTLTLVTMNRNGVASYVESAVIHTTAAATGHARRTRLVTTNGTGSPGEAVPQVFSDRTSQFVVGFVQHFLAQRADQVSVEITLEASPQVVFTLATWGNATASFRVSCTAGGVMHGSTADVDYLLFLKPIAPVL